MMEYLEGQCHHFGIAVMTLELKTTDCATCAWWDGCPTTTEQTSFLEFQSEASLCIVFEVELQLVHKQGRSFKS